MNRQRINGILLLLVLGLGTLIWLSEPNQPQSRVTPLTDLLPEDIHSILISNRTGPAFQMTLSGGSWQISEPYSVRANANKIGRLLELVAAPVRTRFEIAGRNLSEFGLAPPAAVVQLNQLEIRVGGTEPINNHRYLAIGSSIYLIKDSFPHLLLAPAESFISPRILPDSARVEQIETPEWRLERSPDSAQVWQLTPAVEGLSMDRLIEKADEWKNAQALQVVRAPAAAPVAEVRIQLENSNDPIAFGILEWENGRLLVREDLGLGYDLPRLETLLAAPIGRP